ncbi:MAG TPA: hypothetical protein VGR01_19720 [Burkholderiales bacterium]|jgi:hypothetical protein|nr:hypothetical protein [Burkholderiales bacterium]
MREKDKGPKVLADVRAGKFPGGTRAEWHRWHKAETERIAREASEQVMAMLELQAGAPQH